jgi:putative oxidoreductase
MQPTTARSQTSALKIVANVFAWILAVLLALAFFMAGGIKLISRPGMVREFEQIGFGQWLRYVTGIFEVSGAVGVLIPKFRFWAALLIACVMVGATLTNLFILHLPGTAVQTAILLALALTFAALRRPRQ